MRRRKLYVALIAVWLLVTSGACPGPDQSGKSVEQFSSDVASAWFEEIYDVVKAEEITPPPASRIYGITAVALYEAIVSGTEKHLSLVGQLNALTSVPRPQQDQEYHWPTVANTVVAATIRGLAPTLSPTSLDAINALEQRFANQFSQEVAQPEYARSVTHGQAVANAILAWAGTDGLAVNNNCPYVPAPVPGAWKPTPPLFNPKPLQPCWGQIRPMVLTSGGECAPPGHPAFATASTSAFYAAALEVYNVGLGLTEAQKTIATYWSDNVGDTGTPPPSQVRRRACSPTCLASKASRIRPTRIMGWSHPSRRVPSTPSTRPRPKPPSPGCTVAFTTRSTTTTG